MPPVITKCINSWQIAMPEYEYCLWNESNFDLNAVDFVRDAVRMHKWAFVADYVRLYALFNEGGVYLDTDVLLRKPLNQFLQYRFFSGHEVHPHNCTEIERQKLGSDGVLKNSHDLVHWIHILSAVMGAEKYHPFIGDCLSYYNKQRLYGSSGKPCYSEFIIGPRISKIAESYGYRYKPVPQILQEDMHIESPEVFVGNSAFLTKSSYAIHLCNGSWLERSTYERILHELGNRFPILSPMITLWRKIVRNLAKPFLRQ